MKDFGSLLRFLVASICVGTVIAQQCQQQWGNYDVPRLAPGWSAQRLVGNLAFPRHMVFDENGTLLVADRGAGIRAIKINEQGRCISLQSNNILIQDSQLNHGLALSPDGRKLFASSVNSAWVWDYNPATTQVSNKRQIIQGMAFAGHSTRTLLIPRSQPNTLLVQQGSNGNWDNACRAPNGGCNIKAFDITNIPNQPYHFYNSGTVLSWGLRNTVGFDDTSDGQLFSVENSADELRRNNQGIHQNNPAEEMNYHGRLGPGNPMAGRGHGYPDCVAAWNVTEIPNAGNLQVGDQFIPTPNNTFTDATCQQRYERPVQVFPAHVAPLDVRFFKPEAQRSDCTTNPQYGGLDCSFRDYAFMTMHGSWNRNEPIGYSIGYIEFAKNAAGDLAPVKPRNDKTGWNPILSPQNFFNCPFRCFRPTGIAFDRRGRVYVSSDSSRDILVLTRN